MMDRRRLLLTSLAGVSTAPAADAQPPARVYRIGALTGSQHAVAAVKEGLLDLLPVDVLVVGAQANDKGPLRAERPNQNKGVH